jgi:predicted HAD superfamily Cof-like phosphohydrolase
MHRASKLVREFHEAFDIPVSEMPHLPVDDNRRELRQKLLNQEFKEYRKGERKNDLVAIADGLADMVYIICGTAIEYGIPFDKVFAEVHRSNMTKVREGEFINKGDDFSPPRIAKIITDAIYGEENGST